MNERQDHLREMTRWRDHDIKGNRKTLYTKEVAAKTSKIMTITEQTRLEKLVHYEDPWPMLNWRKKIMKARILVNETALAIISSRYFEGFIITIIFLNCITLAQSDSTKPDSPQMVKIELAFQILYTIEMVLRITATGFIMGQNAYLRSIWNQLDFVCVVTGYLGMLESGEGGNDSQFGALRAFRVLRPLRAVNNVEGLKVQVQSVVAAIPLLKDTIIVLLFFFLIFAIAGLNLFMGMLKQRCVNIETGATLVDDEGEEPICGDVEKCPEGYFCGKQTLNPNFDVTNFDNIFWSLLVVFQCITLEGWSEIMVMYAKVYTGLVFFFFVPLVFIGAFFLLNLTLAVINSSYSETIKKIKAEKQRILDEQNQFKTRPKTDDENFEDDAGKSAVAHDNIGVGDFFVAKRAAKKLKDFARRARILREEQEAEERRIAQEEKEILAQEERMNQLRRAGTLNRSSPGKNSSIVSSPANGTRVGKSQTIRPSSGGEDFVVGQSLGPTRPPRAKAPGEKGDQLNQVLETEKIEELNNKTITEEEEPLSDDENFQMQVAKFLQETDIRDPEQARTMPSGKKLDGNGGPIMAFNDVRISGVKNYNMTYDRTFAPKEKLKRGNWAVNQEAPAEAVPQREGKGTKADADLQGAKEDWFL